MSFSGALYTLLIEPLEVLFEIIYVLAYHLVESPGLAIIALSLVMNLLLLPLYKRTDAIQLEAIETEKRLRPMIRHIKKTFHGDEQFMMLQTYYRQNHYKPTDALKGISPLLLEIPFFMAAYHYLSHLSVLHGAEFGLIGNLGMPDGMISIGSISINLLPILMTLINVASSMIYTKDAPLKTKIQLYGMAALFLILLYDSPAGLAFYWMLNNLFSLIKNILMKAGKPLRIVGISGAVLSLALVVYTVIVWGDLNAVQRSMYPVIALCLLLPLAAAILGRGNKKEKKEEAPRKRTGFILAGLVLTLLLGVLIPASLIHTSPEEFILTGSSKEPNTYILYTGLIFAGFFLIWMGIFYGLMKPSGRRKMEFAMWALCGVTITDYMFFGKGYGLMSSQLVFDLPLTRTPMQIILNLLVLVLVVGLIYLIWAKKVSLLRTVSLAVVIAMAGMSGANIVQSHRIVEDKLVEIQPPAEEVRPLFRLSKTGKNVVILMMDRAVSGFVPFLFEEKPELRDQFAGFTYYPNTISFGGHTNIGLPSVFGGYEYRPHQLNLRDREPLEQKHNEALKVLPTLFSENGFKATFCDPTYAGYDWHPDLSIFRDLPQVDVHITMGRYNDLDPEAPQVTESLMERKFLFYSLFKASPVLLQGYLYDEGRYQNIELPENVSDGQSNNSNVMASGQNAAFVGSYNVLKRLPQLTEITDDPENTLLMMCNDTTHSPQQLQKPDYVPQMVVDNRDYDAFNPQRTNGAGETVTMTKPIQVQHYDCNMAAFLQLGKWMDYLRENDVYDNTRIIMVSDHGYYVHLRPEMEFGDNWDEDIMFYNPLLFVKDFDSQELTVDETFMTNADVPTLATQGLIENPVNPYTGNPISNAAKDGPMYVFASHEWDASKNNGTTYIPGPWLQVSQPMMDPQNWVYVDESQVS